MCFPKSCVIYILLLTLCMMFYDKEGVAYISITIFIKLLYLLRLL